MTKSQPQHCFHQYNSSQLEQHCRLIFRERSSAVTAMLCTSCRRTLLLRLPSTLRPSPSPLSRTVTTVPATQPTPPSQPPASTTNPNIPPPALSSSTPGISQPLSTPTLPSASTAKIQPGKEVPKPTKLVGSIPGGAPLFGVAYLKAKPTVLAMEDDAYPDWLWGLVDEGKKSTTTAAASGGDAVDLSCKLHRTLTQDLRRDLPPPTLFTHTSRPHS